MKCKKKLEGVFKVIIIILAIIITLRMFVYDVFKIPSESMLPTIQIGDWIVVDKFGYGGDINLFGKHLIIPNFRHIERGEIVVFHFPEGDTIFIDNPTSNYYELKRKQFDNKKEKDLCLRGKTLYLPLQDRIAYVKRCIGLPGDTVCLKRKDVLINGQIYDDKNQVKHLYAIYGKFQKESLLAFSCIDNFNGWKETRKLIMSMSMCEKKRIQYNSLVDSVIFKEDLRFFISRFLLKNKTKANNYNPIIVPKKGERVNFTKNNVLFYERIIDVYEKNDFQLKDGIIYINNKKCNHYIFQQDYYFVLGDNRPFSMDSRNWGFVPKNHLIGKAFAVGWSKNQRDKVRYNRIGKILNN